MQILDYLQTTEGIVWTILCVPIGFLLTFLAYYIINHVPAAWLCEYGEEPASELLSGQRVSYKRSGVWLSVLTSVCLVMCRLQFNHGFDIYFAAFSLIIVIALMIAVSDIKYMIIPDQFTAALALLGAGISLYDILRSYRVLHSTWWAPLVGIAIGAGVMLLVDVAGMLVYKKEGMGFGDVKLFAAIGMLAGITGTICTFFIAVVAAMGSLVVIAIVRKVRGQEASSAEKTAGEETPETASEGVTDDEAPEIASEEVTDDEAPETASDESADEESKTGGTYFAFGPYIAVAVIAYLSLFDIVLYLAESYLKLFGL